MSKTSLPELKAAVGGSLKTAPRQSPFPKADAVEPHQDPAQVVIPPLAGVPSIPASPQGEVEPPKKADRYRVRNSVPTTEEQWELVTRLAQAIKKNNRAIKVMSDERITPAMIVRALIGCLEGAQIELKGITSEETLNEAIRRAFNPEEKK
jgi:hypothetical protein